MGHRSREGRAKQAVVHIKLAMQAVENDDVPEPIKAKLREAYTELQEWGRGDTGGDS